MNIASKAFAFIQGRGYVTPQDVKSVGMDILRHRIIVSYEAEAEEKTSDDIIKRIFEEVEVP
jgi:MoxR-like ATPase